MDAIDHLLAEARQRRTLPPPVVRQLLRKRVGLTQREIADILDVSRPAVTRYESGARDPRGRVRLAYAELLDRIAQDRA
jgi:predicted transcriptional regulator